MVDLSKMFKHGIRGDFTHIHPLKVLKGVTAADAQSEPAAGVHSIWANLYHMLFWHKLILQTIHDPDVDWKAAQGKDWPSTTKLEEKEWNQLLEAFEKSLEEAEETMKREDLTKPIPSFPDTPIAQLMLVLAQHNSYHLGQIVVARQLLGKWSPPKDS